ASRRCGTIEDFVLEVVLASAGQRSGEELAVTRPDHQRTVLRQQLDATERLQLAPETPRLAQQWDVPRAFRVRGADEARFSVGRATVMGWIEAIEADRRNAALGQPPQRHRS